MSQSARTTHDSLLTTYYLLSVPFQPLQIVVVSHDHVHHAPPKSNNAAVVAEPHLSYSCSTAVEHIVPSIRVVMALGPHHP